MGLKFAKEIYNQNVKDDHNKILKPKTTDLVSNLEMKEFFEKAGKAFSQKTNFDLETYLCAERNFLADAFNHPENTFPFTSETKLILFQLITDHYPCVTCCEVLHKTSIDGIARGILMKALSGSSNLCKDLEIKFVLSHQDPVPDIFFLPEDPDGFFEVGTTHVWNLIQPEIVSLKNLHSKGDDMEIENLKGHALRDFKVLPRFSVEVPQSRK